MTLAERIDGGGQATIYAVKERQGVTGIELCAKVVTGVAGCEIRQRLLLEYKVLKGLAGSAVCQVVGVFEGVFFDGQPCAALVMERLHGLALGDVRFRLSWQAAALVAIPVLRTLSKMHKVGWVHRDVTPSNIFLATADGAAHPQTADELQRMLQEGVCKPILIDFALATGQTSHGLTETGAVVGTRCFIAPEQVCGGRAVAQSDLYSLAVTMVLMVTGVLPRDLKASDDMNTTFFKILRRAPEGEAPFSYALVGNEEMASCLERMLEYDPEDRDTADVAAGFLAEAMEKHARFLTTVNPIASPVRPQRKPTRVYSDVSEGVKVTRRRERALLAALWVATIVVVASVVWVILSAIPPSQPVAAAKSVKKQQPGAANTMPICKMIAHSNGSDPYVLATCVNRKKQAHYLYAREERSKKSCAVQILKSAPYKAVWVAHMKTFVVVYSDGLFKVIMRFAIGRKGGRKKFCGVSRRFVFLAEGEIQRIIYRTDKPPPPGTEAEGYLELRIGSKSASSTKQYWIPNGLGKKVQPVQANDVDL